MNRITIRGRIVPILLIMSMLCTLSAMDTFAASGGTKISGYTYPKSITVGKSFALKGKISSNKKIKRVEIGVVKSNGTKWTAQKYDNKKVNAKTFKIAKADSKVKFRKLKEGTYYYRIYAHTSDGKVHLLLNKKFTVNAKKAAKKSTSTTKVVSANKIVSITGMNKPASTHKIGKELNAKGIITSKETISRVEIGIVYAPTNKWTSYKYDKKGVNAKSFDISKAASKLRFDKLAGGKYRYRIYVHTSSGVTIPVDYAFSVSLSSKPNAAVKWAINIANDDTFSYGAKPKTNKVGCYFCGTNCGPVKKRKPKGYEKTYVCMTFVHAAYAHGAKDPELLKECQKGNNCMGLEDTNLTHYTCWMKVGLCKDLTVNDLLPGDVIIWYSETNNSGHMSMYVGNGAIVDSTSGDGGGWGPKTIAVRNNQAASYLKTGAKWHKKSYVMRYCKP